MCLVRSRVQPAILVSVKDTILLYCEERRDGDKPRLAFATK